MNTNLRDNLNLCHKIVSSIEGVLTNVCDFECECENCKYTNLCDMVYDFRANLIKYISELADREGAK